MGAGREAGEVVPIKLCTTKIFKRKNADGTYRWYRNFEVPAGAGGGAIRCIRFDTTDEDRARGFNRTEHLRPIPPGHPDYERLYGRRADIESINRALDDSMWLGRAHSLGHARQLVDLLGYALAVNSVALPRRRAALAAPRAQAA